VTALIGLRSSSGFAWPVAGVSTPLAVLAGSTSELPQDSQNFDTASFSTPHCAHVTVGTGTGVPSGPRGGLRFVSAGCFGGWVT
jgi:hypothetical protein